MQYFIFRHNVTVQDIAFFCKSLIDTFSIYPQFCRNVFNTKYGKFQFSGICNFLSSLMITPLSLHRFLSKTNHFYYHITEVRAIQLTFYISVPFFPAVPPPIPCWGDSAASPQPLAGPTHFAGERAGRQMRAPGSRGMDALGERGNALRETRHLFERSELCRGFLALSIPPGAVVHLPRDPISPQLPSRPLATAKLNPPPAAPPS